MLALFMLFPSLLALLYLERQLHASIERIGRHLFIWLERAMLFHAAIFLPGVALHEFAHWLTAVGVGIGAGRISLYPERQPDGSLRLGYAEVGRADPLREALVGAAPLFFGAAVIIGIGYWQFNFGEVAQALTAQDAGAAWRAFTANASAQWGMWLYLLFVVANSMTPSPSDRRAWLPAALIVIIIGVALYIVGIGSVVMSAVAGPMLAVLSALAIAWAITVVVDLLLWPVIALAERWTAGWARRRRIGV